MTGEAVSLEEAAKMLAEDKRQREVACTAELRLLLERHKCKVNYIEVTVNGKIVETRLQVEAL